MKYATALADPPPLYLARAVISDRSNLIGQGFPDATIGRLDDVVTVVFAALGEEAISVISMRPASAKERKLL